MEKLKIFIALHKTCKTYQDSFYIPIHVGRQISQQKKDLVGILGDDTGDNISNKNKSYCEITALYWIWKNVKDVEYIGLAHYRRFFETKYTIDNIDGVFRNYDVILAKPFLHDRYMEFKLIREILREDEIILLSIIKRLFPEYEKTVIDYLYDFVDFPFNMFIMRRKDFDAYCSFLFAILFECEKKMKELPYTCSSRKFGYIAEFLLPVYCLHNKMRIKTDSVVNCIGIKSAKSMEWHQKLKIKILHFIYDKHKPKIFEQMYDDSVLVGLRQDKIIL